MYSPESKYLFLNTTTSILVTLQDLSSHLLPIDVTELFAVPFILTMVVLLKVLPVQVRLRQ
jgi:hypothetical protein